MSKNRRPAQAVGSVRIVGGHWRGTRLAVADVEGLRPTSDRVRETLFNWLMPQLPAATVLDVFAGSGALGLEAVSRGAASATLIERDAGLMRNLRETVARLSAGDKIELLHEDALAAMARLAAAGRRFDIAFLDPPFAADLWQQSLQALLPLLADQAALYVETPSGQPVPLLPAGWQLHREGATRDVAYRLYRRD